MQKLSGDFMQSKIFSWAFCFVLGLSTMATNAKAILIQAPFEDIISASEYMLLSKPDEAETHVNYMVMDKLDFQVNYPDAYQVDRDIDRDYFLVFSEMIDRCLFIRGFAGNSGGLSSQEIRSRSEIAAYHFHQTRGISSFYIIKGKFLVRSQEGQATTKTTDCALVVERKDKVVLLQGAK
jgi:hypothetical protein